MHSYICYQITMGEHGGFRKLRSREISHIGTSWESWWLRLLAVGSL